MSSIELEPLYDAKKHEEEIYSLWLTKRAFHSEPNPDKTPFVVMMPLPTVTGYLHIGHAKAITIDFGMAEAFGGKCNLRFDDTNPVKEDVEYVDAIKEDIHWLGFDWEDREYYASDYFGQLYDFAVKLINLSCFAAQSTELRKRSAFP